MKYLPSLAKVSQEIVATGIAIIVVAYLVSRNPTLRKLVKNYDTN